MKWKLTLTLVAAAVSASAESDDTEAAANGRLMVVVSGFEDNSGVAAIDLWSGTEGWLVRPAEGGPSMSAGTDIRDRQARFVFDNLPYGEYAITAYHDRNDNGRLDTGLFGIPKERLGFSNGVRPRFSSPSFQDAAFHFESPAQSVHIEITRLP
jgi:uncharacterized protein (DUF2141 family)